jgi:hypothetical protein
MFGISIACLASGICNDSMLSMTVRKTRTEARSLAAAPLPQISNESEILNRARLAFLFVEGPPSLHVPRIVVFDYQGHVVWAHKYLIPGNHSYEVHQLIYSRKSPILILVGAIDGKPILMTMNATDGKSAHISQFAVNTRMAGNLVQADNKGEFRTIIEVEDGYVTTGWISGPSDRNLLLVKYSPDFSIVWQRICGGRKDDEGTSVAVDNEGNLLIGGSTQSKSDHGGDAWVLKTNKTGEVLGETALEPGSVVGFVQKYSSERSQLWYALVDDGAVYQIAMKSLPAASRTWNGAQTWTRGGATGFAAEANLTCVDSNETIRDLRPHP